MPYTVFRKGVRVSRRAKNGASRARCTAEPTRLAEYTARTRPSSSAPLRVRLPLSKRMRAAGRPRMARKAVSGIEMASIRRTADAEMRSISRRSPRTLAEVSRGITVTITDRKKTVPPIAMINREP